MSELCCTSDVSPSPPANLGAGDMVVPFTDEQVQSESKVELCVCLIARTVVLLGPFIY